MVWQNFWGIFQLSARGRRLRQKGLGGGLPARPPAGSLAVYLSEVEAETTGKQQEICRAWKNPRQLSNSLILIRSGKAAAAEKEFCKWNNSSFLEQGLNKFPAFLLPIFHKESHHRCSVPSLVWRYLKTAE